MVCGIYSKSIILCQDGFYQVLASQSMILLIPWLGVFLVKRSLKQSDQSKQSEWWKCCLKVVFTFLGVWAFSCITKIVYTYCCHKYWSISDHFKLETRNSRPNEKFWYDHHTILNIIKTEAVSKQIQIIFALRPLRWTRIFWNLCLTFFSVGWNFLFWRTFSFPPGSNRCRDCALSLIPEFVEMCVLYFFRRLKFPPVNIFG